MVDTTTVRSKTEIIESPGVNVDFVDTLTHDELWQFMATCKCEHCGKQFVAFDPCRFCSPACMSAALGEFPAVSFSAIVLGLGWSTGAIELATKRKPYKPHLVAGWSDVVDFHWSNTHLKQIQIALKLRIHSYRRNHQTAARKAELAAFKAEWGIE